MKVLKKCLLITGLFLSLSAVTFAQQYTLRDQTEIAYQAQLSLEMYKDLLNVISYANLATESEIKELIKNSYSKSRAQIFYSAEVIIEDNIKPSNLQSGLKQDKTVKDYLNYFDLAYAKANKETISFYGYETSNLKFKDYLYIKVKYTSEFKGRHKEDSAPYKPTERLAELRAEKKEGEWKTYITSIVYYDPKNPVSSKDSDLKLNTSVKDDGTFSRLISQIHSGNGSAAGTGGGGEGTVQKKEQDFLFNFYLEQGESALAAGQFEAALLAFSEAGRIYPSSPELQEKITAAGQARNQKLNSPEARFEIARLNADRAFEARDYLKAKELYTEALRMRPDDQSLKDAISRAEVIIRKTVIPESKYNVGEYKEAVKDYTKAIKEDKENADYYYGRGKSHEKLDGIKEALADYSKAIELDGNFIEALSRRAGLYARTGEYHPAIADYTIIISNPGYASEFYPKRAEVKKELGDLSGAVEDYNMAIRLDSGKADNYFRKGEILNLLKKPAEAISSLSEAIKRESTYTDAYFQRGLANFELGKLPEAAADFASAREQGLKKNQESEIYKISYGYYARGEEAMKNDSFEAAEKYFADALLISPGFGRAWLRKGDAHSLLKDFEQAISSYTNAIEKDNISVAYFKRGRVYEESGDFDSALKDFNNYLSLGPEVIEVAQSEAGKKKPGDAVQLTFAEDPADAFYALGYAQMKTQHSNEALGSLDNAIKLKKFFPKAYFARGMAFYDQGDFKRAVKDMEESIRQGLSDPFVFVALGKAYYANGEYEDAVLSFSHCLKLEPDNEAAYLGRAVSYKDLGQYMQALDDVNAVLLLNDTLKKDAAFLANKGLLELYLKKFKEADQSFEKALSLSPDNPWALYGKAGSLAHQGRPEEAMKWYSQAFQTRRISWSAIKNDPLISPVKNEKAFKNLVKTYL